LIAYCSEKPRFVKAAAPSCAQTPHRAGPAPPCSPSPKPLTGALAAYKLSLAEERIAELKGRLEEMRQERDRARACEDAWKTQCEAVTRGH